MNNCMIYKKNSRQLILTLYRIYGAFHGETISPPRKCIIFIGEHPTPTSILDIWKTCNIQRQKFDAARET
jgi:hypothetical protein